MHLNLTWHTCLTRSLTSAGTAPAVRQSSHFKPRVPAAAAAARAVLQRPSATPRPDPPPSALPSTFPAHAAGTPTRQAVPINQFNTDAVLTATLTALRHAATPRQRPLDPAVSAAAAAAETAAVDASAADADTAAATAAAAADNALPVTEPGLAAEADLAAAAGVGDVAELRRREQQSSPAFQAAQDMEWQQRHLVIEKQAEEAQRLKRQRRAEKQQRTRQEVIMLSSPLSCCLTHCLAHLIALWVLRDDSPCMHLAKLAQGYISCCI